MHQRSPCSYSSPHDPPQLFVCHVAVWDDGCKLRMLIPYGLKSEKQLGYGKLFGDETQGFHVALRCSTPACYVGFAIFGTMVNFPKSKLSMLNELSAFTRSRLASATIEFATALLMTTTRSQSTRSPMAGAIGTPFRSTSSSGRRSFFIDPFRWSPSYTSWDQLDILGATRRTIGSMKKKEGQNPVSSGRMALWKS